MTKCTVCGNEVATPVVFYSQLTYCPVDLICQNCGFWAICILGYQADKYGRYFLPLPGKKVHTELE